MTSDKLGELIGDKAVAEYKLSVKTASDKYRKELRAASHSSLIELREGKYSIVYLLEEITKYSLSRMESTIRTKAIKEFLESFEVLQEQVEDLENGQ